jgi:hypothetical protein
VTATTSTPATGLPTVKRPARAGIGKLWIYGNAGIGKSTTALDMDPDGYIMDTEGSTTALRSWLEGFVDHVAFAEIDADGNRVLHTQPSADYLAKVRVPKGVKPPADPLGMRGPVLRKALEALGKAS